MSKNSSFSPTFLLLAISQVLPLLGHIGNIILYFLIFFLYLRVKNKIVISRIKYLWIPLTISLFIGLLVQGFGIYEIVRDLFYLLSSIMILLLGEVFADKISKDEFLKNIVRIGYYWAAIFVILNTIKFGFSYYLDPRTVRESGALIFTVNSTILMSIAILSSKLIYRKHSILKKDLFILFICLLSIYLSGSRTILFAIILVVALIAYPKLKRHKVYLVSALVLGSVLYISLSSSSNTFVDLIMKSKSELTATDFSDQSEMNENYRAYEASIALLQISNSPVYQQILGQGIGAAVDMRGYYSPIKNLQFLPIIHNGYPYMIMKIGVFGMIVFLWFFIKQFFFFWKRKYLLRVNNVSLLSLLCCGSLISVLVMNSSVTAIFNSQYNSILIIVGFSLKYFAKYPKIEPYETTY